MIILVSCGVSVSLCLQFIYIYIYILQLGLQPFQVVVILGFNSVQWHVSALGTIFAGYVMNSICLDISSPQKIQIL